jgi:hypothetical protein
MAIAINSQTPAATPLTSPGAPATPQVPAPAAAPGQAVFQDGWSAGSSPPAPRVTGSVTAAVATAQVTAKASPSQAAPGALSPEEQSILDIAQHGGASAAQLALIKANMMLQNLQASGATPQQMGAAEQAVMTCAEQTGASPAQLAQLQAQLKTQDSPSGSGITPAQQTILSMLQPKLSGPRLALVECQMQLQNAVSAGSPSERASAGQNLLNIAGQLGVSGQQLAALQIELAQMNAPPSSVSPEQSMLLGLLQGSKVSPAGLALMQGEMLLQNAQAAGGPATQGVGGLQQQLVSEAQAFGASPQQLAQLQLQLKTQNTPSGNGLTPAQQTLLAILGNRISPQARVAFAAQMALQNKPTGSAAQAVLQAAQALGATPAQASNLRLALGQLVADAN